MAHWILTIMAYVNLPVYMISLKFYRCKSIKAQYVIQNILIYFHKIQYNYIWPGYYRKDNIESGLASFRGFLAGNSNTTSDSSVSAITY